MGNVAARIPARASQIVGEPTRRRAGVFRRALRGETSRLRDRRRVFSILLLGVLAGIMFACLFARGEASGVDARAYWAAIRLWLNGGDPYHPAGPFLPYVYSSWMLPLFVPWALLPWEVAWFVWRGLTILGFLWTFDWAYRRRPVATAILCVFLALSIAGNLDTGNINLPLAVVIFAAQFMGPKMGGFVWAIATAMKWAPALVLPLLSPRARFWGLLWLAVAALLTLATLPATLVQLEVLFGFPRPPRIDYLVFIWSTVPWFWRHPEAFSWIRPSVWQGWKRTIGAAASTWSLHWRRSPERTYWAARRLLATRLRTFLGIGGI